MKLYHFYSYFYALKSIKKLNSKLEKDGWVFNNNLDLRELYLYFLPAIKKVYGSFWCSFNQLTTLQGMPQKVGRNFDCSYNQLTTLQGSPQEVGGYFNCSFNQLTTLRGVSKEIDGDFNCYVNKIENYSELDKIKVGGKIYK